MICHIFTQLDASQEKAWDVFVSSHAKDAGFLQSTAWATCQNGFGHMPVYFQWSEGEVKMQMVGFIQPWYVGLFLYVPRGPVMKESVSLTHAFKDVEQFAKQKNLVCVEIDSVSSDIPWKHSTHTRQPQETLIVDLSKSEEELLSQMKQKTRYNIRVAQKQGVRIECRKDEEAINIFLSLLQKTSQRQGFGLHTSSYYHQIFTSALDSSIYIAWHDDTPIAAHFVIWFGKYAIYLHGGSDDTHKALMAPYLLHWQEMMDAKKEGKLFYDFWGIDTTGKKKSWVGFTRFKQGFAPEVQPTRYAGNFVWVGKLFLYQIISLLKIFK